MKKLSLLLILLVVSLLGKSQISPQSNLWLPNGGTLETGVYVKLGWSGTLIIPTGTVVALVDPNFASGLIIIEEGASLEVKNNFNVNGGIDVYGIFKVENTLNINVGNFNVFETGKVSSQHLHFRNPNNIIKGKIYVNGETSLHNVSTQFNNCGELYTIDLKNYSSSNPIIGSGYIEVSNKIFSPNSLTNSNKIIINYNPTLSNPNLGNAVIGNNTLCKVLPVKFKSLEIKQYSKEEIQVIFEIEEIEGNVREYHIQLSFDGINFVTKKIIFPNNIKINTKYNIILNIKE